MPGIKKEVKEEMRALVIKLCVNEGKPKAEVSRILSIGEGTVRNIVKKFKQSGTYVCQKRGGSRVSGLTPDISERIEVLMIDNNPYSLDQLIEILSLNISISTMWRWLQKLGYSYKILRPIPDMRNNDAVKLERQEYVDWYLSLPPNYRYRNLIYLDESPFNLHMMRSHAWGRVGQTPNVTVTNNRGHNVTMILAINCLNVVNSQAIVGTGVDGIIFKDFLTSLVGILGRDEEFTIIMDNVAFHHSNPEFFDNYPYEVKYLPRYSPFLNPCEEAFSQIKNMTRRDGRIHGTDDLLSRMNEASQQVTQQHLGNYINHCERFFTRCTNNEDIARE